MKAIDFFNAVCDCRLKIVLLNVYFNLNHKYRTLIIISKKVVTGYNCNNKILMNIYEANIYTQKKFPFKTKIKLYHFCNNVLFIFSF